VRPPGGGFINGRRITLRWDPKPTGIPYDINLVLVSGSERIGGGRVALRNPFSGSGELVDRRHAVNSSQSSTRDGGATQKVGSYWVAERVD
jgi:hypothetical protein